MSKFLFSLFLFLQLPKVYSQHVITNTMRINPATGNLECTQSQEYLPELAHFGTITVDSFFAIGKIKRRPPLAISLDSIQKLMVYPQMEKDNAISGDYTALFSFDGQGNVDSVWLNIKPYKNFE